MVMAKKFQQVGTLKIGGYVLIEGFVCKIASIDKSKPGKHGTAKARIVAIDVFGDQKRNLLRSTGMDSEVPIIEKGNAQVVAIMGDTVQLLDDQSYETIDVKKPKDVQVTSGDIVEYIRYGEQGRIVRKKSSSA
jgi:translation initiation factor 5A